MLCLSQHQNQVVNLLCLNPECQQFPTACDACSIEHHGHNTISTEKFIYALNKYVKSKPSQEEQQKKEIKFGTKVTKGKMKGDLECAAQSICRLNQRLQKMSQFMNLMYETMMCVEDKGEEQDLVSCLLQQLETTSDLVQINKQFSSMFVLLYAIKQPDPDSGRMEYKFASTQISQIRTQSVLDRMFEFSKELKVSIQVQEGQFSEMLNQLRQLLKENKHFINLDPIIKKPSTGQDIKCEEMANMKSSSAHREVCMVRELIGVNKYDQPEPFHGSKKNMMKLCNYWVFYYNIVCDGTLLEPNQNDIPQVKGKKVLPPIRCAFCKLITSREFKNGYFRYDPTKKFGELVLFRDSQGREICCHEMCIFWSNRVSINLDKFQVDLNTIVMAVQYAKEQICRYCGCNGASMKCNRPECLVHFHFNCIRQVRLMGMQLDFEAKYRFFCEDHVIRMNEYISDWFITRIRIKRIIQAEYNLNPKAFNSSRIQGAISEEEENDLSDSEDSGVQQKLKKQIRNDSDDSVQQKKSKKRSRIDSDDSDQQIQKKRSKKQRLNDSDDSNQQKKSKKQRRNDSEDQGQLAKPKRLRKQ